MKLKVIFEIFLVGRETHLKNARLNSNNLIQRQEDAVEKVVQKTKAFWLMIKDWLIVHQNSLVTER